MFVLGMLLQLIFGWEFFSTTPSKGKRASLSSTDKLLLLTEVGGGHVLPTVVARYCPGVPDRGYSDWFLSCRGPSQLLSIMCLS